MPLHDRPIVDTSDTSVGPGIVMVNGQTWVSEDVAVEMREPATSAQSVARRGLTMATLRGILAHGGPLLADRCTRGREVS